MIQRIPFNVARRIGTAGELMHSEIIAFCFANVLTVIDTTNFNQRTNRQRIPKLRS